MKPILGVPEGLSTSALVPAVARLRPAFVSFQALEVMTSVLAATAPPVALLQAP